MHSQNEFLPMDSGACPAYPQAHFPRISTRKFVSGIGVCRHIRLKYAVLSIAATVLKHSALKSKDDAITMLTQISTCTIYSTSDYLKELRHSKFRTLPFKYTLV